MLQPGAVSARRRLWRGAVAIVLAIAACSPSAGATTGPVATRTVDLPPSYRFVPAAIVVPAGAAVTWTNHDNFSHNVTLEGAAPLPMSPGQSATHTFETAGSYAYVCSLHPRDMKGTVLVIAG